MNNRLARLKDQLRQRLDAIEDPLTGKGLFTSGRIAGLEASEDGKVSFTLEAPPEAAQRYVEIRDRAEAEARALRGVTSVIAVLTAHEAKPAKS
ncbi:MAG TPA: iron-sulfur cluster assembly protein, partial [Vitreimonas sp.]|nr:iron-sulfur cluster assembly protein [Vitreimonas sp.]